MKTCVLFTVVLLVACTELSAAESATRCPQGCTREYNPVCAVDARGVVRTFNNWCQLNAFNCNNPMLRFKVTHKGECLNT